MLTELLSITGRQWSRFRDATINRKSVNVILTQGSVVLVEPDDCRNPLVKVCFILLNIFKNKN
jgi:hypothetical protein